MKLVPMNNGNEIDVFGVGNALVDTLAFVDDDFIREHSLQKGTMTLVDAEKQGAILNALQHHSLELRSGGSAANTMMGISRLGGSGFYSGKTSRDTNGEFYRQDLIHGGIHFDVHPATEKEGPTGTCIVLTTPDAERTMYTNLGVSIELDAPDIDADRLKKCKFTYLEGYLWDPPRPKQACIRTFEEAKKLGVKVAFSFSDPFLIDRHREDFFNVTREYIDVVFCNSDEVRKFAEMENLEDAARYIGNIVELAFITNGAHGALVVQNGKITEVPGFQVKVKDTNGAGDAFAAGVLYGLTHDADPASSARLGNYIASEVVQIQGARLEESLKHKVAEILG